MHRNYRIGALTVFLSANRSRFGAGFSIDGGAWQALARLLRPMPADTGASQLPDAEGRRSRKAAALPRSEPGSDIEKEIRDIRWYHTIDLGNGIKTPGLFDHGPILDRFRLPARLTGKRVLDVATYDGYWAFEFERRGASEVVAIDLNRRAALDLPPRIRAAATAEQLEVKFGRGFDLARKVLRSNVQRVNCSVYDLAPDVMGMFDVVHSGDLLLHLDSPVRALQNIARVCSDYAVISEPFFPELDSLPEEHLISYLGARRDVTWWKFGLAALRQMIEDAGFRKVEAVAQFRYGLRGGPESAHHAVFKAYK